MATVGETMREPGYFGDVRSRIHWGPILGGVAVAFAVYFLLTLFGIAIGLSAVDPGEQLGAGTALWSVVAIIVALFIGGMVTTRCAVGEDRTEAMLYGAIVWGVTFVLFMWLMAVGVGTGLDIFMGGQGMQQQAQQGGQQQALGMQGQQGGQQAPAAQGQQQAQQPGAALQNVRPDVAAQAAWWAFIAVLLSIIASIGGAMVGQNTAEGRRHRIGTTTTPVTG